MVEGSVKLCKFRIFCFRKVGIDLCRSWCKSREFCWLSFYFLKMDQVKRLISTFPVAWNNASTHSIWFGWMGLKATRECVTLLEIGCFFFCFSENCWTTVLLLVSNIFFFKKKPIVHYSRNVLVPQWYISWRRGTNYFLSVNSLDKHCRSFIEKQGSNIELIIIFKIHQAGK